MFDEPYERPCEVQFSDVDLNGPVHHLATCATRRPPGSTPSPHPVSVR